MKNLMYETWETKCPNCGYVFGGRVNQLGKISPMACPHCKAQFMPDIVSPAGCLEAVSIKVNLSELKPLLNDNRKNPNKKTA